MVTSCNHHCLIHLEPRDTEPLNQQSGDIWRAWWGFWLLHFEQRFMSASVPESRVSTVLSPTEHNENWLSIVCSLQRTKLHTKGILKLVIFRFSYSGAQHILSWYFFRSSVYLSPSLSIFILCGWATGIQSSYHPERKHKHSLSGRDTHLSHFWEKRWLSWFVCHFPCQPACVFEEERHIRRLQSNVTVRTSVKRTLLSQFAESLDFFVC